MRSGWIPLTVGLLGFVFAGTVAAALPSQPDAKAALDVSRPAGELLTTPDSELGGEHAWRLVPALGANGAPVSPSGTLSARGSAVAVTFSQAGPAMLERGARGSVTVVQGSVYTGTFLARATAVPTKVTATLDWYDESGAALSSERVSSAAANDRSNAWTRYTVAGLAPSGASSVTLGSTLQDAKVGSEHRYASTSLTRRAQGSTALVGPLTTSGNTIRDASGNVVALRGFNRAGRADETQPAGLTEHDVARMKAWGANVVRLTLSQPVWLRGCSSYRSSYPTAVDRAVGWITRRGMLAVLDLQYGSPTCSTTGLTPMPDRGSQVFWRQVGNRYKNQPLVAFDLFNEPHDVSDGVWRDGGWATTQNGTTYRAVGMQTLVNTVRGLGATNLVLVGGLDHASTVPTTAPLRGPNLVYAAHAYECAEPWKCTSTDARAQLERFVEIGRTTPVILSEFGHPTTHSLAGTLWNQSAIDFADRQGWSWAVWAWHTHGRCGRGEYFSILSPGTCNSTNGTYQPSPTGIPILTGLARNSP